MSGFYVLFTLLVFMMHFVIDFLQK